ncbi:hypothetical protein MA16_Dca003031 [Dendrobium catenatum]|uniref:Uncharacterized protein n=1 Tax=Dendrobium catenatum TaxID=906689 RepID=A0A2I0X9B8_9ASPA|nr:hypothetical protein MA16_Dca003031 [Dendrobium catenatum]
MDEALPTEEEASWTEEEAANMRNKALSTEASRKEEEVATLPTPHRRSRDLDKALQMEPLDNPRVREERRLALSGTEPLRSGKIRPRLPIFPLESRAKPTYASLKPDLLKPYSAFIVDKKIRSLKGSYGYYQEELTAVCKSSSVYDPALIVAARGISVLNANRRFSELPPRIQRLEGAFSFADAISISLPQFGRLTTENKVEYKRFSFDDFAFGTGFYRRDSDTNHQYY